MLWAESNQFLPKNINHVLHFIVRYSIFFKFCEIVIAKFSRCTRCVIMCYLPSGDLNVLVLCLQPLPHNNVSL
ncbi:hypothetical protein AB205_0020660 [Aquarana catesbeiana]|uniref:Uncharacterized protein n=1 Tax=Aquarana catesbeiana TaxID=8400 RepID=A0A2G9QA01_AQUCT|nr:hypothetical protein AB205_0020660 [Aquarana catesbeiana]